MFDLESREKITKAGFEIFQRRVQSKLSVDSFIKQDYTNAFGEEFDVESIKNAVKESDEKIRLTISSYAEFSGDKREILINEMEKGVKEKLPKDRFMHYANLKAAAVAKALAAAEYDEDFYQNHKDFVEKFMNETFIAEIELAAEEPTEDEIEALKNEAADALLAVSEIAYKVPQPNADVLTEEERFDNRVLETYALYKLIKQGQFKEYGIDENSATIDQMADITSSNAMFYDSGYNDMNGWDPVFTAVALVGSVSLLAMMFALVPIELVFAGYCLMGALMMMMPFVSLFISYSDFKEKVKETATKAVNALVSVVGRTLGLLKEYVAEPTVKFVQKAAAFMGRRFIKIKNSIKAGWGKLVSFLKGCLDEVRKDVLCQSCVHKEKCVLANSSYSDYIEQREFEKACALRVETQEKREGENIYEVPQHTTNRTTVEA